MLRNLLFALTLLLLPCTALSQITFSAPDEQLVLDSLAMLPVVRAAAAAWRTTAGQYERGARQLGAADFTHTDAYEAQRRAFEGQARLLASAEADTDRWRHRARRRGVTNFLLSAAVGGLGYLLLKP